MENKDLLEKLLECAAACNHCAAACLNEKEVSRLTGCIKTDLDCADICTLVAKLLARESAHGHHLLKECREICLLCADECDQHAHMKHCKKCASICRDCAAICEEELAQ